MTDFKLTVGAVPAMHDEAGDPKLRTDPILQVLSIKKVSAGSSGQDRYRLILSDGQTFTQAMMALQLNPLLVDERIVKHSILKVEGYASNVVQERRILICLAVEPLGVAPEKIGSPVSLDPATKPAAVAAAPAPAAPVAAPPPKPAAVAKPPTGFPIFPIESLSPYQNKWTIKARVTSKSDIRHWSNARGEGKLFSVNLLDETGEIKATAFNDAVDRLYSVFDEGKVYYISKARVNIAKKQFSNLTNEYEIMFENNSDVTLADDQEGAPQVRYQLVKLDSLGDYAKDATVDVLGVVVNDGDLGEITARATQRQVKRRELSVVDDTQYMVRVTLWGRMAEDWQPTGEPRVCVFKGARVGDFSGRTLSMGGQSTVSISPDIPEAHALRGWYQVKGSSLSAGEYSQYSNDMTGSARPRDTTVSTIDAVKAADMGADGTPQYFTISATIMFISEKNLYYPACPSENCNKKVTLEGNDQWRCEKCNAVYPAPEYRYILTVSAADHTGQLWLSGFNDAGQAILHMSANELEQLSQEDTSAVKDVLHRGVGQQYSLSIRAKVDSFNDQTRMRYQIMRLSPVDYVADTNRLLSELKL